uniref:AAA ATPase domain-containing protein n=1 Tax=Candidatus Kentrum sp. TUN TaxID=2126343 RepID=A0A451APM2_9GAMM|nr:MAG: AAA ATPase domain-containing protein [Candidatus Kentron sp. TUN]VFK67986.1 MAG: AAA ATPase domain-containing protein [Candidatus Kentron sp. TUN]
MFFPKISISDSVIWGVSLLFSLGFGVIAGFYDGINDRIKENTRHGFTGKQIQFPSVLWIFCLILAAIAWFPDPATEGLNRKLEILAACLALTPVLFTGLPLYPLVALGSLWQCRTSRARGDDEQRRAHLLPLRWQTFAYPLPGLRKYLVTLARHRGMAAAMDTLQRLQSHSLQVRATRMAAGDLASQPDTALPFCARLTTHTNARTLLPFAETGPAARALIGLTHQEKDEDEQPLQVYVRPFPPRPRIAGFAIPGGARLAGQSPGRSGPVWFTELEAVRPKGLGERLAYSLARLDECPEFSLAAETRELFLALQGVASVGNAGALMMIPTGRMGKGARQSAHQGAHQGTHQGYLGRAHQGTHQDTHQGNETPTDPREMPAADQRGAGQEMGAAEMGTPKMGAAEMDVAEMGTAEMGTAQGAFAHPTWLVAGWEMLDMLQAPLIHMAEYRTLTTPEARRDFLSLKVEQFQAFSPEQLPRYWRTIAKEILDHWVAILEAEAKQARERLRLAVHLPEQHLATGTGSLLLTLVNESGVVARDIRLRLHKIPDLHWGSEALRQQTLEGRQTVNLLVNTECYRPGAYSLAGTLSASELDGQPYRREFAFRLAVGEAGTPYVPPTIQPYQTGEGLGSDTTFVGRGELLRDLRSLWHQPHGKPAVVLIGQRRIGKSSLLHKIRRDGLAEIRLHPLVLNIQGATSAYAFLNGLARDMAKMVSMERPHLRTEEPYADFTDFLLDMAPGLGDWRFLLMLDEADLIPQQHLGELMPGFLRTLMQDPQYPTLLLFCGTHALKRIGREYSSIFFNTAQVRTVSYMSAQESREVLEKPARDTLEFAPATLDQAYEYTRGQPLLLQMIGATLIRQFDRTVSTGKERGNYVSPNDLEQAVEAIVKQEGNAAFENHWNDNDATAHRVLSGLAWILDETNRPQLDLPGIEAALEEVGLSVPHKTLFEILERLHEEEMLINEGVTYRFAVPLYRRWIAWRWGPDKVREEAGR